MSALYRHYALLVAWNKRMNLTTVKAGPEIVIRHYCESLFFAAHIPSHIPQATIADLGSGPGFPGIPIAVLNPSWTVSLVESNQRKAVFLRESTRELSNVIVDANRAEDVLGRFDWLVSRAVDPAEVLSNVPSLAPNVGLLIGERDFSKLKSTRTVAWLEPVRLPWGDQRVCVYGTFV